MQQIEIVLTTDMMWAWYLPFGVRDLAIEPINNQHNNGAIKAKQTVIRTHPNAEVT